MLFRSTRRNLPISKKPRKLTFKLDQFCGQVNGINPKTMLIKGFWASLLALIVVVLVGFALATFWPAFGTA